MERLGFVMAGLLLAMAVPAYAFDDGDFRVWHTEKQEWQINKKSKLTVEEELRLGDGGGNFYYQHYDAGYVYSLNKSLDLGINYRQVYEKKGSDFKPEERPHLNATLNWGLWGLKFDDRSRLEYRHFDWQEDSWRYRNKFSVKFPWKPAFLQIQPYLADEIFVPLNGINLNRNRFYSGIGFKLTKNIKAELYYMLEDSKSSGKWTKANVLGSALKAVF